jgi:hypothetical protein
MAGFGCSPRCELLDLGLPHHYILNCFGYLVNRGRPRRRAYVDGLDDAMAAFVKHFSGSLAASARGGGDEARLVIQ